MMSNMLEQAYQLDWLEKKRVLVDGLSMKLPKVSREEMGGLESISVKLRDWMT